MFSSQDFIVYPMLSAMASIGKRCQSVNFDYSQAAMSLR